MTKSYLFEFKDIRTQKKFVERFDSTHSVTIKYFLDYMHNIICEKFKVKPEITIVDVIEAGHYNHSNGQSPEFADKLDVMYSPETKLEKIYQESWKLISFYVRLTKKNAI